jgi:hypothetical protein
MLYRLASSESLDPKGASPVLEEQRGNYQDLSKKIQIGLI